jgi:hypothetical protein
MASEDSRSASTNGQHCCDPRTNIDTEHVVFRRDGASAVDYMQCPYQLNFAVIT